MVFAGFWSSRSERLRRFYDTVQYHSRGKVKKVSKGEDWLVFNERKKPNRAGVLLRFYSSQSPFVQKQSSSETGLSRPSQQDMW
jgi:hypothetical protein